MTLALVVGGFGVVLAFLMADFAERLRHRMYEARGRRAPESAFKHYLTVALATFFLAWSIVAYV